MAAPSKMRYLQRQAEVRNKERYYSLVEGKYEYQYDVDMAARLAAWCKERKAAGLNLLFKEFYDSLDYYSQHAIRIKEYKGGPTFRY